MLASLSSRVKASSAITRGVVLMLLAAFCSSAMNGVIRHLSVDGLHPFEIAFFRSFFGLLVLVPVFFRYGLIAPLRTKRVGLHAARGVLNVVAMLTFFLGVSLTPLATVAALSFTSPLFATLGAILLLKETMGIRRWTGLILGFMGALVILRPGVDAIDPGALLIVLSSALWACALIDIKVLSRTDSSLTITLWAGLFVTPLALLAALQFWRWPTSEELAWLLLIGALGSIGQLAVAQALHEVDATVVLPLDFTKLVWGATIGYLFFFEIPDLWTFVGATLIVASVTYIAYRERRVKGVPTRLPGPTRPM